MRRSNAATAVPRLLAMLCILSVFIPTFIMREPVRSLFMPLTLAVGFAMIASYLLSSTLVPVLCVWLLKHQSGAWPRKHGLLRPDAASVFEQAWSSWFVRLRWLVVPAYLAACGLVLWLVGRQVGTELFPAGRFGPVRAPLSAAAGLGLRADAADGGRSACEVIERGGRSPRTSTISMGYVGLVATEHRHQQHAAVHARARRRPAPRAARRGQRHPARRVARAAAQGPAGAGRPVADQACSEQEGVARARRSASAQAVSTFGFEPGDIVSEVMSFGSPTPVEVGRRPSPNMADAQPRARRSPAEMKKIPILRDVQLYQQLDYPTVRGRHRSREGRALSGVTVEDVADALLVGTSSSRYVAKNYWRDPKTRRRLPGPGPGAHAADEPAAAGRDACRCETVNPDANLMVRDVADGRRRAPCRARSIAASSQRYLSITANVEGEDLGRAVAAGRAGHRRRRRAAARRARRDPRPGRADERDVPVAGDRPGVSRGGDPVLLTGYFQSPRLGLISIGAVPGVLCGVAIILLLDRHDAEHRVVHGLDHVHRRLGVELGDARDVHRRPLAAGAPSAEAAVEGASERLRPILMTACAMTVGMVPMALALEEGSEMKAPLGRAVIGGLVVSTFATLLVVPAMFALVMGKKVRLAVDRPGRPRERALRPERLRRRRSIPTRITRTATETATLQPEARSRVPHPMSPRMPPPYPENTDAPRTRKGPQGGR